VGSRREQLLVVGLIALIGAFVLASTLTAPDDRGTLDPRPSTFRAADPGALALFLTLEELGADPRRRLSSWADGRPLEAPLALLSPTQPLTPLEVDSLMAWVERGGQVIYAAVPGDALLERLELMLHRVPDARVEEAALPQPHPWTEGLDGVRGFTRVFDDTSRVMVFRRGTPLLTLPDEGVAALVLPVGEGRVVAWSDARPLNNAALRESGAALLFARAAIDMAGEAGIVEFDEFHHGYREGVGVVRSTFVFLRDTGPGRMALQLGVAALGLLLLAGRRFGTPHPPPPARRRSPLEHVEALAGAYRQGGARATARHQVVAGLARRVGRAPPRAGAEGEWLDAMAARVPAAAPFRDAWQGDDADPVALARLADDLVLHLRHRTRSR
jgi:hypothetical protein